jgi:hypothetical protein
MTSVGHIQQIVTVIRQQMAARGQPVAAAGTRAQARPGAAPARRGRQALQASVGKRVQAIDPHDPQRGRRAFRIFLEAVLLSEFGDSLINDPAFYHMVDEIQQQLESTPTSAPLVASATAILLSRAPA